MDAIRLGPQGWNYDAWRGPFYPTGTLTADFLSICARAFDTVEVDATYYAVPAAKTLRGWAERVPAAFVFALKLPQSITRERRLRRCETELSEFEDRARELGDRLGPILIQLSPDFGPGELPALEEFLPQLSRDFRYAVEFRDRAWISDRVLDVLTTHRVALALTDARWVPRRTMLSLCDRPTADFAYVRWMGPDREIVDYSRVQVDRTREIDEWVPALARLVPQVQCVYGYMNNHFAGHSPATLRELQRRLGLPVVDPASLGDQLSLLI